MNDSVNKLPFIQDFLDDPLITEIMIDNWQHVYVQKEEALVDVASPFQSNADILSLLHTIAQSAGTQVDEKQPVASFYLPDTTRVEVVLPPIAVGGPAMSIAKPPDREITLDDLLNFDCISPKAVDFLKACVKARLNIAISGGTSSGKTHVLRVLSHWIPSNERILFLQNMGKPNLPHPHLLVLETRFSNPEGQGKVNMSELVRKAMSMRPDRIITEEVRGAEMLDLLNAMNHGYDGCLFSLHSDGPRDTLTRIERMAGLSNPEIPLLAMREQVSSAVDVIVHQERLRDGSRKVTHIDEVHRVENGVIILKDIFLFNQTGLTDGKVQGSLLTTGLIPAFLETLEAANVHLPVSMFAHTQID